MPHLNPAWIKNREEELRQNEPIDRIESFNLAIQWLITEFTKRGKPFKLYNLGAGVKRITTETNICPCCKKVL